MVYGPIAAYLIEAFPAKVRYTSLSLPYHIGNGVLGIAAGHRAIHLCGNWQLIRRALLPNGKLRRSPSLLAVLHCVRLMARGFGTK